MYTERQKKETKEVLKLICVQILFILIAWILVSVALKKW